MVTLENRLNPQSDFLEQKRFKQGANFMQIVFYAHTKNGQKYVELYIIQ